MTIPELAVTTTCNTEVTIPDVQPWTAETPRLYDATVSTDTETVTVKIGFRTVAIDGDIITVNGEKSSSAGSTATNGIRALGEPSTRRRCALTSSS
nr:hypothetical protein [Cutibacterium modestum]